MLKPTTMYKMSRPDLVLLLQGNRKSGTYHCDVRPLFARDQNSGASIRCVRLEGGSKGIGYGSMDEGRGVQNLMMQTHVLGGPCPSARRSKNLRNTAMCGPHVRETKKNSVDSMRALRM